MALKFAGKLAIETAAKTLQPFRQGNVSGTDAPTTDTGRMPHGLARQYAETVVSGLVIYVFASYGTPIVWAIETTESIVWRSPYVDYSLTSDQHRNAVLRALSLAGRQIDRRPWHVARQVR